MGGRPLASETAAPRPRSRSRTGGGAMACAGLLTVCLVRPPAPEPPRPPAPAAGPTGHALFQDVSGERARGAGSLALGIVAVFLEVALRVLLINPWVSLALLAHFFLNLFFPISVRVSPDPGPSASGSPPSLSLSLGPCCLCFRMSLLPLSPYLFVPCLSHFLCISPYFCFSATAPAAPQL